MIFLSEAEQIARWGPILVEDLGGAEPKPLSVPTWPRTGARAIGGVATALSIVVPLLLPTFSVHLFNFGPGTGGNDDINIENPMVDLRRDLLRGEDIDLVIELRTDDPDPSYLRIAVLNRFSDNEWSSGDRDVPSSQTADGSDARPRRCLRRSCDRNEYDYDPRGHPRLPVHLAAHHLSWSAAVEAPGDWRYDVSTMDFLASDDDLDTSQLTGRCEAIKVDYDANRLAAAPPVGALVSRDFTELPSGLDPIVGELAEQVTGEEPTRFEKAVALQQWFREDGGFNYDDERRPRQRHRRPGPLPHRGRGRPHRLLRAVRRGDGRDGPRARHPGPGRGRLPQPRAGRRRRATSTAPTTCTPGPSCSSPAPAGSGSSRRPPRPGQRRPRLHHRSRSPSATASASPSATGTAADDLPARESSAVSPADRRRRPRQ